MLLKAGLLNLTVAFEKYCFLTAGTPKGSFSVCNLLGTNFLATFLTIFYHLNFYLFYLLDSMNLHNFLIVR